MTAFRRITSRQNPVVARVRAAARGGAGEPLLLDGLHLVAEAAAAGLQMRLVVARAEAVERDDVGELVARLDRAGVEVATASAAVMDALSPVRSPSVLVALADRPPGGGERLYASARPTVAIACGVQDPGNLGAIVRVAEASGAAGLVAARPSADPFGWKALRGSMGSALRLPIATDDTPEEAVANARRHGCRVVAAVPRDGRSLFDADLRAPIAVLIGGEGPGLDADLVGAADERVTIPMEAPVESLNAAVTAALLLYEARRQRER